MPRKFDLETEKEILNKYKNGLSFRQLSVKYECSLPTIRRMLKINGIIINSIPNKKYEVNENYFENIDTEEKAYWLGFLYVDGYVRMIHGRSGQLKLKLHQKDKRHIELFRKCLNSTHPIKDGLEILKKNNREYKCYYSVLNIYSTKMVKDLFNNGCMNNKTFKLKFPEWLREDLIRHFIRGYFDGDGCIYLNNKALDGYFRSKCNFLGNMGFITKIKEKLENIIGKIPAIVKRHNIYSLDVNARNKVKELLNYLYDDSTIYLNRKYDKYKYFLKSKENYERTIKN